jgi:hypothetical protein
MATYTDWMTRLYDSKPQFRDQKLGHIVIPGTHDSGSFSPHMTSIPRTQDRNLGEQLEDGIRYFDLRILMTFPAEEWFFLKKNTFYLVHNMTSAIDLELEPQLDAIAKFAAAHPKEIIILNMNSFAGAGTVLNKETREAIEKRRLGDLISLVDTKLGRRIFRYDQHRLSHPNLSQIPVRAIAEAGGNIIIISNFEDASGRERLLFWPADNLRGSYAYTTYISSWWPGYEDRLKAKTVDALGSQDHPVEAWSEKDWFDGASTPDVKCDGFPVVLEKLLLRRHAEARRHNNEETPPYKGVKVAENEYVDLSRRLLVIEFGFSTADISDSVKVVNPYVLDLMKDLEKGKEGTTMGSRVNTRRQINVVAFDFYNHFNVIPTVVEMNEQRLPMWRPLGGGLQTEVSSKLAVGRNQNGLPQAFGVGKDGKLWSNWETLDGSWRGWTILREAPKGVTLRGADNSSRIAVVPNLDGALEVFACGSDGNVWHTWQPEPNARWGDNWESRGGRPFKSVLDIAAGKNKDGLLDLFVINREDACVYHTFQTLPGGGVAWIRTWEPLGKPPKGGAAGLAVSQDSEGRLELIVLSGSQLYRIRQSEPNSDVWEKVWKELATEHTLSYYAFAVGRNKDGRLEVFAQRGRHLWHTWQRGTGNDWDLTWEDLGAPPEGLNSFDQFAVGNDEDGRLVAFAFDPSFRLWRVSQILPNDRWGQWVPVSGDSRPNDGGPQFGRTIDGAPILVAFGGSVLWGHEV